MLKTIADLLGFSVVKLVVMGGFVALVIAAATTFYLRWRSDVQQEVLQKIEEQNVKRENKAFDGIQDVNVCYARGGEWDRTRGLCREAKP